MYLFIIYFYQKICLVSFHYSHKGERRRKMVQRQKRLWFYQPVRRMKNKIILSLNKENIMHVKVSC